ncbi:Tripeptidyl-peptidase 2 [Schistosoma japonicum]|nr:Tripeptidyl-peptidase 2 [Schistosoma japonicum]
MIDASGSGDVKMKYKRFINQENRVIETLTGRKVELPSHWNPPDGIIRIGVKPASELFPKLLLQRLRNENRDNFWRPCIKRLAANLACGLIEAEEYINYISQNCNLLSNPNANKSNDPIQLDEWNSAEVLNKSKFIDQKLVIPSSHTNSHSSKHLQWKNPNKSNLLPSTTKAQLKVAVQCLEDSLLLLDQRYSSMEIVYDCFIFHNGSEWVACVDTSPYNPNTTLSDLPLLRDYAVSHEYASFGEHTQLYYTVKILDNGNLLQIVTNNSSHGTHVAAIASAYFPTHHLKNPFTGATNEAVTDSTMLWDRNGVAPGAQIISIKISDSRLGSMETGISLLRAIRWTIELKCDIVNYSFGEQVIWPNIGRISKYVNRMIHKHGIIMVASGGNNGPSLGSLSCPGGTVQGVIGVAPLVFPDMMRNLYCQASDPSLNNHDCSYGGKSYDNDLQSNYQSDKGFSTSRNPQNYSLLDGDAQPTAYNWGSRGPTFDGALGLCVAAPGGANTSVAGWQLKPASLLSGSSMSAPMVTGGISLILSGLRHRYKCINNDEPLKIPSSLIYRSLMNTSKLFKHLSYLDQGYGLMQVDKAFSYLDHILHTLYERNKVVNDICTDFKNLNFIGDVDNNVNGDHIDSLLPSVNAKSSSSLPLLQIPDPCITFGWHIRLTVSGPGCKSQNRGIWLRHGWLLSSRALSDGASLPILRYTLNMCIEFDEYVPIHIRRNIELHLTTELIAELDQLTNSNGWLQIASVVTITSTPRDIHFVIDPNRFNQLLCCKNDGVSSPHDPDTLITNSENTATQHSYSKYEVITKHLSEKKDQYHQEMTSFPEHKLQSHLHVDHQHLHHNQLSSFCWPSNLTSSVNYSCNSLPVNSQKPYVTFIRFKATNYPEMGCLASLPIIVHFPYRLRRSGGIDQPRFLFSDRFDAGNKVRRWFVEVPYGATAGILRLARLDDDGDKSCEFTITINSPCIGMNPASQEIRWSSVELNKCGQTKASLKRNDKFGPALCSDDFDCATQLGFLIKWETDCLELTIAQHWGLEMPAVVIGELYFRGLEPNFQRIVLNTSDRYYRIGLRSNFMNEAIQPDIKLTHWCLPVKPYDSKIFYLGNGKNELILNDQGSYALRLMYRFTCPYKTATVISLPWLHDMLYSSDYLINIFHIYDNRGRFIGAGEYDEHREQRPKYILNLQKGDYKVIAQICHENGPSLKRKSSKQLTVLSSPTSSELFYQLNENENSTSVNLNWSPLQSLQNSPILIHFRLTGGMESTSGRKGGSCLPGQSVVQFEFSGFPSSLNLNGSKFCSAMDPLTYDPKQTIMVNSSAFNNYMSDEITGDQHIDNVESHRYELVKRLPCLPSRVNGYETINIFLGLTDEHYPTYAVPGSYFSGTIGFYNSNLLHNLVTYPFRLIMDSSNVLSIKPAVTATSIIPSPLLTPTLSTSSMKTTEQPEKLPISYLGLSVEDLEWIQCLGELFLFNSGSVKHQYKEIKGLLINKNDADEDKGVSVDKSHATPTYQDHLQSKTDQVDKSFVDNSDNQYSSLNSITIISNKTVSDLRCEYEGENADTYLIDHVSVELKAEINDSVKSLCPESNDPNTFQKDAEHSIISNSEVVDRNEDTNNIHSQQTSTPITPIITSPKLTPEHRSSNFKNQISLKGNRNYSLEEFSVILCKVHMNLCTLDKPFTNDTIDNIYNDNNRTADICLILKKRFGLWYDTDYLINGRLINGDETLNLLDKFCKFSSTTSVQKPHLCSNNSVASRNSLISVNNNNLFYHLLNISLPSSSNNNSATFVKKNNTTSATTNLSDSLCNLSQSLDCTTFSTSLSSPQFEFHKSDSLCSLGKLNSDGCVVVESNREIPDSLNKYNKKSSTLTSHVFKLRLIDVLSRYGRLIAERLICLQYLQNVLIHSNEFNWSLSNMIISQFPTNQFIQQSSSSSSLSFTTTFTELYKCLDDIYERLMKLINQPIISNNSSLSLNLQLGYNALPSWLLLSSDYKLNKDEYLSSMSYGSIGGRLIIFFILYMIIKEQYSEVINYFIRLLYQIDEPPVGALRGIVNCGFPSSPLSSFGVLRQCHATLENSLETAKSAHPWLLWLLRKIGWNDIAAYLNQQAPILFPERDYTLLGDD